MKIERWMTLGAVCVATLGCEDDDGSLTLQEAQVAVAELGVAYEGEAMFDDVIEISTNFTIGDGVEAAAEELRAWLESQVDCSTVTVENATVTIDFGELADECVYRGHTYAGITRVTVSQNDDGGVRVTHEWEDMENEELILNGSAEVDWSDLATSRDVVHNVTWTRKEDDSTVVSTGDRQMDIVYNEGLFGGVYQVTLNGSRDWTSSTGDWSLDIVDVEMRWQDPVPQSGRYIMTNPGGKELVASFARLDATTIEITITSGNSVHQINVLSIGSDEGQDSAEGSDAES